MNLSNFSVNFIYNFLIIFSRVGCVMMFTPGIGEHLINTRIRLLFAIILSSILLPIIFPSKLIIIPDAQYNCF